MAGCGDTAELPAQGDGVVVATVTPTATVEAAATVESAGNGIVELGGFTFPIVGGCLPAGDQLLPNAPREYRNGFHEGLDLYESDNCTQIRAGTRVVTVRVGTVIRADTDYTELTQAELDQLNADPTAPGALDIFRGRQVWIDHGGGIITRYAHLSAVAEGIAEGVRVEAGQLIAYVGESGTPESVTNPGSENHLHFEVRIGESFLGADMDRPAVRAAYERLFAP